MSGLAFLRLVLGTRCPVCGERTKNMLGHRWLDHGDLA